MSRHAKWSTFCEDHDFMVTSEIESPREKELLSPAITNMAMLFDINNDHNDHINNKYNKQHASAN